MVKLIEERWLKLQDIPLKVGAHTDSAFCVMEAYAWVHGRPWRDDDETVCPVIGQFLRSWNDALPTDADRDRLLKPLILRIANTRNKGLETKRSLMCADWLVRTHTPVWLRLAGLTKQAESLESLPEITSMAQIPSIRGTIEAVRKDAAAAWDAAWAARAAAGDAARDAAWVAWAAAWAAADAAAAWAAADAAAAWAAAAWAAAWAAGSAKNEKLSATVNDLQLSAVSLVERMIDAA